MKNIHYEYKLLAEDFNQLKKILVDHVYYDFHEDKYIYNYIIITMNKVKLLSDNDYYVTDHLTELNLLISKSYIIKDLIKQDNNLADNNYFIMKHIFLIQDKIYNLIDEYLLLEEADCL